MASLATLAAAPVALAAPSVTAIPAGGVERVLVAGFSTVPTTAKAVALNVTVTDPAGDGFLTVWPCGEPQPLASNLNYVAGQTIPNFVVAKLGSTGEVCVYSRATADVVIDIAGYMAAGSTFVPVPTPTRVLDTREGRGAPAAPVVAGSVLELQVGGTAGVPGDAATVVLNLTVTGPAANGYLTAFPCGGAVPLASNVNFVAGQTIPNLVFARLGTAGKVCLYSSAVTDLVADVSGYFPGTVDYRPYDAPTRLIDTRVGTGAPRAPLPAGAVLDFALGGGTTITAPQRQAGPGQPQSMVLNVTVTDPAAAGFLTLYPCGSRRPLASNVNFVAGQTVANLALVRLDQSLHFCLYTLVQTDVVVDAAGYFPAGPLGYTALAQPARVLDTRVPILTPTSFGALREGMNADAAVAAGLIGPIEKFCDISPQQYGLDAELAAPAVGRVSVSTSDRTIDSIQVYGSGTRTQEGVRVGDSLPVAQAAFARAGYTVSVTFDSYRSYWLVEVMRAGDPRPAYVGVYDDDTRTIDFLSTDSWSFCS